MLRSLHAIYTIVRRLGLLLLFATCAYAQSPVTVTGTIYDNTGHLATSGYVRFTLSPASSSLLYYVTGVGIIAPQSTNCGVNASGLIKDSVNLANPCKVWGNDVITPGNTTYAITFAPNNVVTQTVRQLQITAVCTNLNTPCFVNPVSIVPQYQTITTSPIAVNLIPAADSVFNVGQAGKRYANGYFTNLTVTNSMAFSNLTVNGPLNVTGLVTLGDLNNILYVNGVNYATLASALAACPATGCEIIDTFPETWTVDPFTGITTPFDLHLLPGLVSSTYLTNVPLRVAPHNGQYITGAGPNLTQIQATASFPINSSVVSLGAPGPSGVNGSGIFQLAINCASITGCTCLNLDGVQELSGTMNTQVVNCMVDGYSVNSNQGAGASQNQMVLDHIRAQCSVSAPASCVPVHITSTAGARVVIRDVTAVAVSPTVVTDSIKSDSSNATVSLSDAHVEEGTNGFHHTAAGQFTVDNLTGSSTTTTLVRNDNASASYELKQLTLNGSTNTLIDVGRSITSIATSCSEAGVSNVFSDCLDPLVPLQRANDVVITPPIGAGAAHKIQLKAGFTGSTPAYYVLDNNGNVQANVTNDGRTQFREGQTGAFVQTSVSDTLTAGRTFRKPNGDSATVITAALVTTAAATDNVTIQGMTASGHCTLTPTNAAASGAASVPYVSAKAANQITVTHAVTANMNYDVMCTSN